MKKTIFAIGIVLLLFLLSLETNMPFSDDEHIDVINEYSDTMFANNMILNNKLILDNHFS